MSGSGALNRGGKENEPPGEGVFNNLKIWMSRLVPQRKSYEQKIKENGGEVVLMEKKADLLVCDENKQNPLPGSYSYKLIDDAVRDGSLEKKEEYRCMSPVMPGPSGPGTVAKATRNPYTAKEDAELIKYVNDMYLEGELIGGNVIFKKFAEDHPTHTWQSWQDRWKKQHKPLWTPPTGDSSSVPAPEKSESPAPEQSRQEPTPPAPVTTAMSSREAHSIQESREGAQKQEEFTADDDEMLTDFIKVLIEKHKSLDEVASYRKLAKNFNQHTAQSWRDRSVNHVVGQIKDLISEWQAEETLKAKRIDTGGELERHLEQEHQHDIEGERSKSDQDAKSSLPGLDIERETTTEEQFEKDYKAFLDVFNATQDATPLVMPTLTVGGREVTLWELWSTIRSMKVDFAELDWQQIADALGFDWPRFPTIPTELREGYEQHLKSYADALAEYENDDDDDDEEEEEEEEEEEDVLISADRAQYDGMSPLPSSPPSRTPKKRAHDLSDSVFELAAQPTPKRRRESTEIPSTPDDVNGTLHLQHLRQETRNRTPTRKRNSPGHPLSQHSRKRSEDLDMEMLDDVPDLPEIPRARKANVEPETQDFSYDPETQARLRPSMPEEDTQMTMTPSQQLRQESDAFSPELHHSDIQDFAVANEEAAQVTPTPRRRRPIGPFFQDDSDDEIAATPRSKVSPHKDKQPVNSSGKTVPPPSSRKPAPANGSPNRHNGQTKSSPQRSTVPSQASSPAKKAKQTSTSANGKNGNSTSTDVEAEGIIDHFISLGYPRAIVVRSLQVTSWLTGNASHVMEMLKRGDPVPDRTTGVWTQRDDDALRLVCSKDPPATEKVKKTREKEQNRLQKKHGAEQIDQRKWYLELE